MGTPVRTCLSCRRRTERTALVRLVVDDGAVTVDPLTRRPGRGAYVCGRKQCLEAALRRNGAVLTRALRARTAVVDADALRRQHAAAGPGATGHGATGHGAAGHGDADDEDDAGRGTHRARRAVLGAAE